MPTVFPGTIDSFTNPTPTTDTVTLPHSTQHANHNDAVLALEAKVGVNASAVTTSHDYKLGEVITTDKAAGKSATQTLTNKTLGTGTIINIGTVANGDMYYGNITGVQTRVPVGSVGQVLTVAAGIPSWQSLTATNVSYVNDTGVANAYIAILSPALSSYTAGVLVQFKAVNANTTTSTVNVNGLGVKSIFKGGGATALASGDIAAGMIVSLEYDGTNFVMLNPVANAPLTPTGDGSGLTNVTTGWIASSTTDVTFNNSSAENTLLTYSLAGGTLSTNKAIRLKAIVEAANSGGNINYTFRVKYGGTTLATFGTAGVTGNPSFTSTFSFELLLQGAGTTGTQESNTMHTQGGTTFSAVAGAFLGASSIDSTAAQNITITAQMDTTSVTATTALRNYVIQKIV